MRIVDLSVAVTRDHLRWPIEQSVHGDLAAGDLAQVTTLKVSCHAFTHVDAKRHYFLDGDTIETTPLEAVVGPAHVVDLLDTQPNEAIDPEKLNNRSAKVIQNGPGAKVILQTGWHRHRDITTAEFWLDAPYLTREAALWLDALELQTICFDFPQDYVIRLLLKDEKRPIEEHVTHDILLRSGVHMVEYLTNTASLQKSEVLLSAAPIKIPDADGAPARVYAIEGF